MRRAAENGDSQAATEIGSLYEQGKGVRLDYSEAYMWYSVAAAGGDSRSIERMKSLANIMTAKQLRVAKQRAEAWKQNNDKMRPDGSMAESSLLNQ